jgi:hypothetical protein
MEYLLLPSLFSCLCTIEDLLSGSPLAFSFWHSLWAVGELELFHVHDIITITPFFVTTVLRFIYIWSLSSDVPETG